MSPAKLSESLAPKVLLQKRKVDVFECLTGSHCGGKTYHIRKMLNDPVVDHRLFVSIAEDFTISIHLFLFAQRDFSIDFCCGGGCGCCRCACRSGNVTMAMAMAMEMEMEVGMGMGMGMGMGIGVGIGIGIGIGVGVGIKNRE